MTEVTSKFPVSVSTTYVLEITSEGKTVLGVKTNGAIELGEGFTADDGARKFWEFVESIRVDGNPVMKSAK